MAKGRARHLTWAGFIGIFALFFATHSIPVRPAIKPRIVAQVGPRRFAIGYSILSAALLALLIWAARAAPYVEIWPLLGWHRHVTHAGMLAISLLLAFSIGRPNPFSFGGAGNDTFDPMRPGIVRVVRHTVLAALALWAFRHMLPNGDLAHVLLFGVLGGFAVGGWGADQPPQETGDGIETVGSDERCRCGGSGSRQAGVYSTSRKT